MFHFLISVSVFINFVKTQNMTVLKNNIKIFKKILIFYAFIFKDIRKQDRNIISSAIQYAVYYINRIQYISSIMYITIFNYFDIISNLMS